jgi:replicative DNA helicase
VPVLSLAQLNRAVEARTDKRPKMSDLRDSGSIEQDADVVIMLYRDDYYDQSSKEPGITELIITKQRNGPTGTVKVGFEASWTRFFNLDDDEQCE